MGAARYGGVSAFESVTRFGNLGVDFFFVLSGFIILHAHAKDIGMPDRVAAYASRRFVRLYPVYWLYTIGFAVLLLLGVGSVPLPTTWEGWLGAVTLVRVSPESPPLDVAWTLFHEVMFYAVFAVLIANRRAGIALLTGWMALCLVMYQYPGVAQRTPFNVFTAAYNLNFALGMGAYWLYRSARFSGLALTAGVLMAAGGVALGYAGSEHVRIVFAVGCALMMGGLSAIEQARSLRVPSVLILLGDASYTVYLVHAPIQGVVLKVLQAAKVAALAGPHLTYVLALVVATATACAVYKIVEVSVLRGARRLFSGPGRQGHQLSVPA